MKERMSLMSTSIVEFSKTQHLEQTVDVLLHVREADPEYPPPADSAAERGPLADWLLKDDVLGRWAAVSGGRVVGHIQVTKPHEYIFGAVGHSSDAYDIGHLVEIGKFFVSPLSQKSGIGTLLFEHARAFIVNRGGVAVLAVLPSSANAVKFYSGRGMRNCGSFIGVHGDNLVFIDPSASLHFTRITVGDEKSENNKQLKDH